MGRRVRLHLVHVPRGIEHSGDEERHAACESAPAYRAAAVLTKELHASDFRSFDHLDEIILQQTCIFRRCPLHGSVLSASPGESHYRSGPAHLDALYDSERQSGDPTAKPTWSASAEGSAKSRAARVS